ncbi:MAG: AraC family transcriptional regulator [Planctomycetes bacterium]|nr:AraC family transcriptional regulator [Planctomycetota bacterium]
MTDRLHWKSFFSEQHPVQFRRWRWRSDHFAHDHDFYELVVVAEGEGDHISVDGTQRIAPGDVIFMVPGVWHEYSGCTRMYGYDCCFSREILYRDLAWLTDDPVLGGLLLRNPGSPAHRRPVIGHLDEQGFDLVRKLLGAFTEAPGPDPRRLQAGEGSRQRLFGALVVVLGCLRAALGGEAGRPVARPSPALQSLTRRALELMTADLTAAWTLDSLASCLEVSPSLLSRAFRTVVGRSPMAHYGRLRMEHAAMLLLRSDLPVAEIAARVGVFDANYFARRFRSEMGLQPTAYRRRFQDAATG